MISNKMETLGKKPSVIRAIFEYSRQRKAEIGAENVFDFSLGNPSIAAPEKVNETLLKLIKDTDSVLLHGYTSAQGDMNVRAKIASNIEKRFGAKADANHIYMTCGAAASLTISLKALCNEGDEVIILAPYFPEYCVFIENAGASFVAVKSRVEDFGIDFEALEKVINQKTKAIIINSPNNPSGAVVSEDDIKKLATLLEQKGKELGTEIYIISDEPYRELVYGDVFVPYIPNYYNNTLVCYSYSKSLSLPGERIGYIFGSPKAAADTDIYAAVCGAGRSMGYVCAPSMLQYAVAECDGTPPDLEGYSKNRNLLYNSLTEMGYDAVRPDGAFYLFVKALESDANAFCERAKKYELLLVPGDGFGMEGYVRIAYCVSYEQIEKSLPAFKKLYDEYK